MVPLVRQVTYQNTYNGMDKMKPTYELDDLLHIGFQILCMTYNTTGNITGTLTSAVTKSV